MYPHQRERLTSALAAHGAAAFVATTEANVTYLTGFRSASREPGARTLAVMTPAGTALVLPGVDAPAVAEANVAVDHVIPYGRSTAAYASEPGEIGRRVREWAARSGASEADALATALTALSVDGAIALDDAGMSPGGARGLIAALGGRAVVDGVAALDAARQVKGPWEIEALERALGIAEEALNAVVQMLKPGTSEQEAVELFEADVRRRGATPRCPQIAFGLRTALPASPPSGRTLRRGDLVRLDVGCTWEGYQAEVTRTAVMGVPEARHEAVFDALMRGQDAAAAAAQPGKPAGNVFAAAVDGVRAAALPQYDADHVGYGIGLAPREVPRLEREGATVLEPGMVLCLDTAHQEHGWGGVHIKDTVLITRTGARTMNRSRRGLLVLD